MVERPGRPVNGVVAVTAFDRIAKRALMVLVPVARSTAGTFRLVSSIGMAIRTGQLRVFTQKRKTCEVVIEANLGDPILAVVAAAAIRSQTPGVDIVLGMARAAFEGQFHLVGRLDMAGLAFGQGMLSAQQEAGHRVVVEVDFAPARFSVATFAICAVAPLMLVVLHVAIETGPTRFQHLHLRLVTRAAACRPVRPAQGKIGQPVMLEPYAGPSARVVASGAFGADGPLMHVILGMA